MSHDVIYLKQSVYEAAQERITWLFDEFERVIVDFSGGKDSTVILNLALEIAEQKGRLPLTVRFLDQEAEWQGVIDYVETVMMDDRIDPMWLQIPFRLSNSTSQNQHYLNVWGEGEEWMREKHPISLKENVYGADRFHGLWKAIARTHWPDERLAILTGMRAEESNNRFRGITSKATYKGVTWGKIEDEARGHYNFFPIYDWSYTDVWKDRWLLRYAACLIKIQWGSNLTKFEGMQLPGGVQFNGQKIYDDAIAERQQLEEEMATAYSYPPEDMVG